MATRMQQRRATAEQWLLSDPILGAAEEVERKNAPITAKQKLVALGLTEAEIEALTRGLVR